MPGDIVDQFVESRPARSILIGLVIALGAVAASALLARLRNHVASRVLDDDAPYLGWVANVLNEDRRPRSADKPTLH